MQKIIPLSPAHETQKDVVWTTVSTKRKQEAIEPRADTIREAELEEKTRECGEAEQTKDVLGCVGAIPVGEDEKKREVVLSCEQGNVNVREGMVVNGDMIEGKSPGNWKNMHNDLERMMARDKSNYVKMERMTASEDADKERNALVHREQIHREDAYAKNTPRETNTDLIPETLYGQRRASSVSTREDWEDLRRATTVSTQETIGLDDVLSLVTLEDLMDVMELFETHEREEKTTANGVNVSDDFTSDFTESSDDDDETKQRPLASFAENLEDDIVEEESSGRGALPPLPVVETIERLTEREIRLLPMEEPVILLVSYTQPIGVKAFVIKSEIVEPVVESIARAFVAETLTVEEIAEPYAASIFEASLEPIVDPIIAYIAEQSSEPPLETFVRPIAELFENTTLDVVKEEPKSLKPEAVAVGFAELHTEAEKFVTADCEEIYILVKNIPPPPAQKLRSASITSIGSEIEDIFLGETFPAPPALASFSMLDTRRRSSQVYRSAMNILGSKEMQSIPRDLVTDALNWTSDSKRDSFQCESEESAALMEMLETMKTRQETKSHMGNQTSPCKLKIKCNFELIYARKIPIVVLQSAIRGWICRLKYKSLKWIREHLRAAMRSRSAARVEEALAASRALLRYCRSPEHDRALAALDTIREEEALRPKLVEMSELICPSVFGADDSASVMTLVVLRLKSKPNTGISLFARKKDDILVKQYTSVMERVARCRSCDCFAFQSEDVKRAEFLYEAVRMREIVRVNLRRSTDRLCPAEMMQALREFDSNKTKFLGVWENGFLNMEVNETRDLLVQMQHEEPAITEVLAECGSGGIYLQEVKQGTNTEIAISLDSLALLEQAIARACQEIGSCPASPGADRVVALGNAVLALRTAILFALRQQMPWSTVDKLLGETRLRLANWVDCIPRTSLPDKSALLREGISKELDLAGEELDKRAGVYDLIQRLHYGVERRDVDVVSLCLEQGGDKLADRTHDANMQSLLQQAQAVLTDYSEIHRDLIVVLDGRDRNPVDLARVAEYAQTIVQPGSTDDDLVNECNRLCKQALMWLQKLYHARDKVPDRQELHELAREIRYGDRLGGMPELAMIDTLLCMTESRLIQEQLRVATKDKDDRRRVLLSIRFRQIHLAENPGSFLLNQYPDLKDAREWFGLKKTVMGMGRKFQSDEVLVSKQLSFSTKPIHHCLTRLVESDAGLSGFAIRANRVLLAYAGDAEKGYGVEGDVCVHLHEVLCFAADEPRVRDELLIQAMKHLTNNSRAFSTSRTWNFFAFCLCSFTPSSSLDLFLELFIRTRSPESSRGFLLNKLHAGLFGEAIIDLAPSLESVRKYQNDGAALYDLEWRRGRD